MEGNVHIGVLSPTLQAGLSAFLTLSSFKCLLAENNPYTKVAYFVVAYSVTSQYLAPFVLIIGPKSPIAVLTCHCIVKVTLSWTGCFPVRGTQEQE